MALNLPDSLYEDYSQLTPTWSSPGASSSSTPVMLTTVTPPLAPLPPSQPRRDMVSRWIHDIHDPRPVVSSFALHHLANNKNDIEDLPLLLWDSLGVNMLLREIIKANQEIQLPFFCPKRAYNVLLLFQCIAHHPETRSKLLKAKTPNLVYPLMDAGYINRSTELVRIGALGVIAHLLKPPVDAAAVRFLMDTCGLGCCLRAGEIGYTESKTLALFILQKTMSSEEGLKYCCTLGDRCFVIDDFLKSVLMYLSTMPRPSSTLLNLVAACYARLSDDHRGRSFLRRCLPVMLMDNTFASLIAEDPSIDHYRKQVIENMANNESKKAIEEEVYYALAVRNTATTNRFTTRTLK